MEKLPIYISIVLCAVKDFEIIKKIVQEINKKVSPHFIDCDIILVDNSGSDDLWKKFLNLRNENLNLKIFRQEKVTSHDNAILRGFKESRGNYIILPTPGTTFFPKSILGIFDHFRDLSTYKAINGIYLRKKFNNRFRENKLFSEVLFENFNINAPVVIPSIFTIKKSLFEKVFTFLPSETNCFLPSVEAILHKYFSDELKILFLNEEDEDPILGYGKDAIQYSLFKYKKCINEVKDIENMLENIEGLYSFD